MTLVIYIFSPLAIAAATPLIACLKRWKAKKCIIQYDMNKKIKNWTLDIALMSAMAMTIIFISCLYYSGLPIIVPITFFSLLSLYMAEKYMIINFYVKCP